MDENRHFHRTVLAYVNQVFQQISGINLITYYAAVIFQQQIGLSGLNSRILAGANGTEYFIASWIAVFTIEKFGRRSLMLFGAAGMSASMVILAVMTSPHLKSTTTGIVAAAFLFIFNTFFAIGWLGMTWLYPAEIVPLRIRAPANALSTSANWAFNFMVVMITPVSFASIGYRTYIIFAVMCVLQITPFAHAIDLLTLRTQKRLHRPSGLFLLSRDGVSFTRGNGQHLLPRPRRVGLVQRGEGGKG